MQNNQINQSMPTLSKQSSQKLSELCKNQQINTFNKTDISRNISQLHIVSENVKHSDKNQINQQSFDSNEMYLSNSINRSDEIREQYAQYRQIMQQKTQKKLKNQSYRDYKNQSNRIGFHVYHNKALQILKKVQQNPQSIQQSHTLSNSKNSNREIPFQRVHSLNKRNHNSILSKKNQIKIKMEKQLNYLWMDALNNMGLYKQEKTVAYPTNSCIRKQEGNLIRIQNIGHNLRYIRRLKPIPAIDRRKNQQLSQWKMKILGKGQNMMKAESQTENNHKRQTKTKITKHTKNANQQIFKQKIIISQLDKSKKNVYSEDNESERYEKQLFQQNFIQIDEQIQTLNHSQSDYQQTSPSMIPKNSKHSNNYMISSTPQQPMVLAPQSTILYKRSREKSTKRQRLIKNTDNIDTDLGKDEKSKTKKIDKKNKNETIKNHIRKKQFKIPFETYYYRDLLWKVNFANQMIIQTPLQYEHRLRLYIGKGNNSGMIRGLMKRRIWFAITDRIQDANFVWTQLKYLPYFDLQDKTHIIKDIEGKDNKNSLTNKGFLNRQQQQKLRNYFQVNISSEEKQDERFIFRNNYFTKNKIEPYIRTNLTTLNAIRSQKIQNHFINNYIIGNKKTLFKTLSAYYKNNGDYVFNYLPYTFHVGQSKEYDQEESYEKFMRFYEQRDKQIQKTGKDGQLNTKNYWIIKPGQNSNRGFGIKLCKKLQEIKQILQKKYFYQDGTFRTFILQTYIDKPLLYQKRKFDIRHFMMMTCVNGVLKGYWYRQGYVRTTSSEYSLDKNDGKIHLTNDAIQKMLPQYGKYQKGNKISYDDLESYLSRYYGYKNYKFKQIIIPKMKKIGEDIMRACSGSIDPDFRGNNFQLFGLDFMIDSQFNLWLIEVNTNPCLQISCPILGGIIPKMIENIFEIVIDPLFPPPARFAPKGVHYYKKLEQQNNFDLLYDSRIDGIYRESNNVIDNNLLQEEDETFQDDGSEWNSDDN